MKELKRTITTEETYGFEAFDGTTFFSKEECKRYEDSAYSVAKRAASAYKVKEVHADYLFKWFCGEDTIIVYDIPDTDALFCVNQFIVLSEFGNTPIPTSYVGKRVAVFTACYDGYMALMGSADDLLAEHRRDVEMLFTNPDAHNPT